MGTNASPSPFFWGAATASYQIEGAVNEDGRGVSIWDTFAHTDGNILAGETGDIATDHYHRWREDVRLMSELHLNSYRLSIAWPRIFPEGRGAINQAGIDFYNRLIDGLIAHNITPFVTLYHWDLPQALQNTGGWLNRDTAGWFAEYANVMTQKLGDRVKHFITVNEPFIAVYNGHVEGSHAPGLKNLSYATVVMRHLLLGHGLAMQAIRSNVANASAGVAYSLAQIDAETDKDEDIAAAVLGDAFINRMALDPTLRGEFPKEIAHLIREDDTLADDLRIMRQPVDFIGVNYYRHYFIRAMQELPGFEVLPPKTKDLTEMGWESYPSGLGQMIARIAKDYPGHDIYVTESGAAYPDVLTETGEIHDPRRITYLQEHIASMQKAQASGAPVKGYFVWSLMDNFEWAYGFKPRFGIVYTDFASQRRYVKDSGKWYADFIANGGQPLK